MNRSKHEFHEFFIQFYSSPVVATSSTGGSIQVLLALALYANMERLDGFSQDMYSPKCSYNTYTGFVN